MYINSPGGDVFAAAEIYTALREHKGRVTVKITGIAASAASVIAMAGDEVLMSPVAYMMVHDPWTYAAGNYREMEHQAAILKEIGEGLIAAYTAKTGKTRDEIAAMLAAETYMNAQKCVDEGFADGILYELPAAPEGRAATQQHDAGEPLRGKRRAGHGAGARARTGAGHSLRRRYRQGHGAYTPPCTRFRACASAGHGKRAAGSPDTRPGRRPSRRDRATGRVFCIPVF